MTPYEIVITVVQFCTVLALILALFLSRREYKVRMRPYVGFEKVEMMDSDKPDEIVFEVKIRNTGQVPAKNAVIRKGFYN
jgi:hypothetical protein